MVGKLTNPWKFSKGHRAALDYLKQWDRGDGKETDKTSYGAYDTVVRIDGYFMSFNRSLGYISLEREIDDAQGD